MATRRKVENDIIEAICCCPTQCLSPTDLEGYLEFDKDALAESLAELFRNGLLKRKGRLFCFPTKVKKTRRSSLTEKRLLVAQYVSAAKEPPTTAEIAKGIGLNSNQVYQICQYFNKKGFFIKGKKPRKKPLFFSLIIRQIMHPGNYELIMQLNRGLRKIIEEYDLKDPKLKANVLSIFKTKLNKYPHYSNAIHSGMERLIRTIERAKTKDEVLELLELRPFYPKVCPWKSVIRSRA